MLEIRNLTKKFGKNTAVQDLNIICKEQEFLVIFGPAGAGKTTTLRLIAGILEPTTGEIRYGDRSLTGVPPERRNMSMAFENYNLYSHLTVSENLAFPLRARRLDNTEINRRVGAMAETLQITPLLDRRPGFLSGGQRQRVALGRAMIREADVYLLDEPISHLDAKLRHLMRGELKAMCADRQANVIYVTHDYKEAMALSDRILVLHKGSVMQIDTPEQVYQQPANEFVAGFLGDPPMSFLDSELKHENGSYTLHSSGLQIPVGDMTAGRISQKSPSGRVRIGVRTNDLVVSLNKSSDCIVPVEVYVVETFGYRNIVTCEAKGSGLVQAVSSPELNVGVGNIVWINLSEQRVHLFSPEGEAISHPAWFKNGNEERPNVIN
jgi:multiple sugar transport system ATP-binding protein